MTGEHEPLLVISRIGDDVKGMVNGRAIYETRDADDNIAMVSLLARMMEKHELLAEVILAAVQEWRKSSTDAFIREQMARKDKGLS